MTDSSKYDKPHAVSGLIAKRKEIMRLRAQYLAESKRLTVEINRITATIKLFEPDAIKPILRFGEIGQRTRRNGIKRFVLESLREASGPLGSGDLARMWIEREGLTDDADTYRDIRQRLSACLNGCRKQGDIEQVGIAEGVGKGHYGKLWALKKGDE